MTLALKNWWQKWFGYTLVEKDNGLYPSRMICSADDIFGPVYAFTAVLFAFVYNYLLQYSETKLIADLVLVAYVALLVLFVGLSRRIERRRFGPLGRPFVLVDQDTLALNDVYHCRSPIKTTLPRLRALHIGPTVRKWPHDIFQEVRFEQVDGMDHTVYMRYNPAAKAAIIDFLRRKLPASVHFTADDDAPLAAHGHSVEHKPV
ncbi:MAG: hypothetical protein LBI48_06725 [Burkholderiaceae bacterium]|nr:hypothetical protein [Burkholderiaceae bacterium]